MAEGRTDKSGKIRTREGTTPGGLPYRAVMTKKRSMVEVPTSHRSTYAERDNDRVDEYQTTHTRVKTKQKKGPDKVSDYKSRSAVSQDDYGPRWAENTTKKLKKPTKVFANKVKPSAKQGNTYMRPESKRISKDDY